MKNSTKIISLDGDMDLRSYAFLHKFGKSLNIVNLSELDLKDMLQTSKEALKDKLIKLSNNDNNVAIEILNQSIANGWQGIFELKQQTNGTTRKNSESLSRHNEI